MVSLEGWLVVAGQATHTPLAEKYPKIVVFGVFLLKWLVGVPWG